MKRLLFLLFFSFLYVCSYAQFSTNVYWTEQSGMPVQSIIYYHPQQKLQWSFFDADPVMTGSVAAITSSGFGYTASMKNNGEKGQMNIGVYCYFSKDKSWVKPDKKNAYILNHEQHHFDVSFITASLFFNKIKSAGITLKNYNVIIPAIYKECCDIMNKMQDDYDGQTKNGQVKAEQEKWNHFFVTKLSK